MKLTAKTKLSTLGIDPKALAQYVESKASLVDLMVSDGIPGVRSINSEQQVPCPFHGKDNAPSMRVYPETNSCYCWTCKESWYPISYLMRKKGQTFMDACNYLTERYGLSTDHLPRVSDNRIVRADGTVEYEVKVDPRLEWKARMQAVFKNVKAYIEPEKVARVYYIIMNLERVESPETFKTLIEKLSVTLNEARKRA